MRRNRRSADFYRIKNPNDTLYYSAGIPSSAWSEFKHSLKFLPIMGDEEDKSIKVGEKLQEEWFPKVNEGELFYEPYLIYLGSNNEDFATRNGYEIIKKALTKNLTVQITNSCEIYREETEDESVFMLHNVFLEAGKQRIQEIRDWITMHEDCFRIVTMGTCPELFTNMIKIDPHAMFYIDKVVPKIKISR